MRSLFCLLFLFVLSSAGATESISGLWRNVQSEAQDSSIVLSQEESGRVHGSAHARWKGASSVWHGAGQLHGNRLQLRIVYTLNPNQWPNPVRLDLTRSADGRVLSGTWSNKGGQSGPLRFEKVAP